MATSVWWVKDNRLGIGSVDDNDDMTNVAADAVVRLHANVKATAFGTDLSQEPNFPEQFHEAILAKTLEHLYVKAAGLKVAQGQAEVAEAMLNLARYWRAEYTRIERDAIIYRNTEQVDDDFVIVCHEYPV